MVFLKGFRRTAAGDPCFSLRKISGLHSQVFDHLMFLSFQNTKLLSISKTIWGIGATMRFRAV